MENDQTQAPADETLDGQPAAPPEAGASGEHDQPQRESSDMDGFIRGLVGAPASKPADDDDDGESAPQGDVKPSDPQVRGADGKFLGRRAAAQRIADLERQLAERDPAKVREQVEAERRQAAESAKLDEIAKTRQADVERYRRLIETPDHKLNGDDYQWRESFKEKLEAFPEVQEFARADAELTVKATLAARDADLRAQLAAHAAKPGVDPDAFRRLPTWGELGDHLYEAGARAKEQELSPRIAALEAENQQLRYAGPRGLGSSRAPIAAGRSAPGRPAPSMDDWIRGIVR